MTLPKAARQPRDQQGRFGRHGLGTLKRALRVLGSRALPTKRTALGRELAAWRGDLIRDLGGDEMISTQQRALVDLAVRSKLLVDSVDAYVLAMPSAVNRQKRCLHPIVRERQALVGQLQSLLKDLGLERKTKNFDLIAQVAALHREARPEAPAEGSDEADP